MDQAKKRFKTSSFMVLLWAGLTLLNIVSELLFGELNSTPIPEGSPDNILLITKIILLSLSLLLLLPTLYVGVKGLLIAKTPNKSKGHIIWAMILFAFSVFELIQPAVAIVKQGGGYDNFTSLFSVVLELSIYYDYIKHAKAVAKLAE